MLHPEIDYIMVLDNDNFVVTPYHKIESFIAPKKDIIFAIRFHNNEVMAGNYIIQNTIFSRSFLSDWMNMGAGNDYLGMNADNGALHWLLLKILGKSTSQKNCYETMRRAHSIPAYDRFIKCFHQELEHTYCNTTNWSNIAILSRFRAFFIDGWLTKYIFSDHFLFHHGLKDINVRMPSTCTQLENYKSDHLYRNQSDFKKILKPIIEKQKNERHTGWNSKNCVQNNQKLI